MTTYLEQNLEQKKLIAEANKILRAAAKNKNKTKNKSKNYLYKVFSQTQGQFPCAQEPLFTQIKTLNDLKRKNRQLGNFEYLENKTYYKAHLKNEGVYFYKNLELVLRKDFYFKPGSSGFIQLTSDGKIHPLTEQEVQEHPVLNK